MKINRPTYFFLQLAIQSLNLFSIHVNDLLKGMLFLVAKLCAAPFKLGGIGPTDVCFPQSLREAILGENEALPDFWLEVMLFWGRRGGQLVPQPCIILWLCPVRSGGSLLSLLVKFRFDQVFL